MSKILTISSLLLSLIVLGGILGFYGAKFSGFLIGAIGGIIVGVLGRVGGVSESPNIQKSLNPRLVGCIVATVIGLFIGLGVGKSSSPLLKYKVTITSSPPPQGDTIWIDGIPQGKTPKDFLLKEGKYAIWVVRNEITHPKVINVKSNMFVEFPFSKD